MEQLISSDIKIKTVSSNLIKVMAITKYVKNKSEHMTVLGLQLGKRLHILFQDAGGSLEFWTPQNIMELYTSGHENMASLIGMDFLTRNKLITPKKQKEVQKKRQAVLDEATTHISTGLIQAVELLKEEGGEKATAALEELKAFLLRDDTEEE